MFIHSAERALQRARFFGAPLKEQGYVADIRIIKAISD